MIRLASFPRFILEIYFAFIVSISTALDHLMGEGGRGKGKSRETTGKGGKGGYRRSARPESARPDSPENWRPVTSPPTELDTQTRIVNANLSLPWMQENLKIDSRRILDNLVGENANIAATAWVPMVELGQDQPAVNQGSVLGGNRCWMKKSEILPVCLSCKAHLNFVCQIDRSSLLHPFQGTGLVQVFACPVCARTNLAKPRASCWATSVDSSGEHEVREVPAPRPCGRRVVKWLPRKDYMHPTEAELLLNRPLKLEEWKALGEAQIRGDKLGGCTPWLNCSENERNRVKCKLCDERMRLLMAIDTFDNLSFEWGNDGSLVVFDCPSHPEQVTALVVST